MEPADRLTAHLTAWLGAWPPAPGRLTVVGSPLRSRPGWDGSVRPVAGVTTPEGGVLSVEPSVVDVVTAAVAAEGGGPDAFDALASELGDLVGRPGWRAASGIFRWSGAPTPGRDPGVWVPTDDPRIPDWLRPFNGDVLVAFAPDADGVERVAAGVGRKQHDRWGHELAVQTEEGFRGQGWARELVTQAGRRVLADGAVPTYLHAPSNHASARTADASGFPDVGWRILGLFGGAPT